MLLFKVDKVSSRGIILKGLRDFYFFLVQQDMERKLDVFNITLSRQQAELEFKKRGKKKKKEKGKGGGWLGGWWGGKGKKEQKQAEEDELASIASKLKRKFTFCE